MSNSLPKIGKDFPLTLDPPIDKLTFGSNYAIQNIELTEEICLKNQHDDTYKVQIVPVESPKFTLTVSETKFMLKKGESMKIIVTLKFTQYVTMGLTGQVQFHIKKKSLLGGEMISRALRFQLQGIIPDFSEKDLIKTSDDEQFRIGAVNGELSMVKNETVVAFRFNQEDPFAVEDYRNVMKAYRNIHHPAILGMMGVILKMSTILLDGDTTCDLEQLMEREKLSVSFLLRCASDCADALNYLASLHIIHRNVKPSKLRVVHHDITSEGKCIVKLNDMTSVYMLTPNTVLKKSPGTYNYTAPEVMELKPHGLPIDVYSFAMTMYHMFSYERPFNNMEPMQIQQFVVSGQRLPISDKFPSGMGDLIQKCWDPEPEKRPTFLQIVPMLNDIVKDFCL